MIPFMPSFTAFDFVSATDCAAAALQNGFPGFALQDGGQCYGTADILSSYAELGTSNSCENGIFFAVSSIFFTYRLHL